MPIFLPNGNVNPAYLAAERKEMQAQSKLNIKATEAKRKKLVANKQFELADYIKKAIGSVGSGKSTTSRASRSTACGCSRLAARFLLV